MDIPAETCEGGLGAARPITDIASQYITADKPEVTASYTSQEVTTSFPSSIPKPLPFSLQWKRKRRGKWAPRVSFHHDNAHAHVISNTGNHKKFRVQTTQSPTIFARFNTERLSFVS